ncbi:hypothetical protein HYN46_17165 [Aquirhabdus parva]|uniref:Uncharacterized protein n=1 Tax=Aquirhabdus parva TaxID=2283318 RepID=A0A345PAV4_9GAMM|nr:hypothetical protein HYN46_17165 [Aquirhabdus parva]
MRVLLDPQSLEYQVYRIDVKSYLVRLSDYWHVIEAFAQSQFYLVGAECLTWTRHNAHIIAANS